MVFLVSVPHGPIGHAQIPVATSTSITLQWAPPTPEDQNGEIRYRVNVTEVDNRGNFVQFSTASTSMTIQSLHPFIKYEIRIAAYTVVGDGPYSSPINVMTKEAGTLLYTANIVGVRLKFCFNFSS